MPPPSFYKIPSLEKFINRAIGLIFYYRLFFVLIAIGITIWMGQHVYSNSPVEDKLKNAAIVLTGGSIIIGIFYSIINYEHNLSKFKHDVKTSREILTFTTANKMQELSMINNFKAIKSFHNSYKQMFIQGRYDEIDELMKAQEETRCSFIIIFNYLESISIGIKQGIMDEAFMKEFFVSIFKEYFQLYGGFLSYLKIVRSKRVYAHCTELAARWSNEN